MKAAVAVLLAAVSWVLLGCGRSAPPAAAPGDSMVTLPGGRFTMGTDDGFPFEGPEHTVELKPFRIARHEVTVAQLTAFVAATGYRTEAEGYGWSGVFDREAHAWQKVDGASWRYPEGPAAPAAAEQEPVTQVSWADADAYCRWRGARLPSEAEFEYAARGGLAGRRYAWGDEITPHGRFLANFWQGTFPDQDAGGDGFTGRAPVGSYPANGYGLSDMTGNVWEWVSDWYDPDYYASSPRQDPSGPENGAERAIRGGSWLCSESYCVGFRVAARSHSAPDSGLNNLGFRCAS